MAVKPKKQADKSLSSPEDVVAQETPAQDGIAQDAAIDPPEASLETPRPKFNFYLNVKNRFGVYQRGQNIFDDTAIQAVIDNGDLPNCNKVLYPPEE